MLKGLAEAELEKGKPVTGPLTYQPDIFGLEWIYIGFKKLSSCRGVGMTVGPIPWTAIILYIKELGLEGISSIIFEESILAMDCVYMEFQQKKEKK